MADLQPLKPLHKELVLRGHYESRSRAVDAIARGVVHVDGIAAKKPSQKVVEGAAITIDDPAQGYVSRAALKLKAALASFGFNATGRTCMDIGSSTGGFTQVILEAGAAHVFAVDVGHDQFHPQLLSDHDNITLMEGFNIRDLQASDLPLETQLDCIVCDVSFISLKLALPAALALAATGAWAAILVKPQFEVGRDGVGKGGLVRDPTAARAAADGVADWLSEQKGWSVAGLIPCPITGSDGNQEYMLGARYHG